MHWEDLIADIASSILPSFELVWVRFGGIITCRKHEVEILRIRVSRPCPSHALIPRVSIGRTRRSQSAVKRRISARERICASDLSSSSSMLSVCIISADALPAALMASSGAVASMLSGTGPKVLLLPANKSMRRRVRKKHWEDTKEK